MAERLSAIAALVPHGRAQLADGGAIALIAGAVGLVTLLTLDEDEPSGHEAVVAAESSEPAQAPMRAEADRETGAGNVAFESSDFEQSNELTKLLELELETVAPRCAPPTGPDDERGELQLRAPRRAHERRLVSVPAPRVALR